MKVMFRFKDHFRLSQTEYRGFLIYLLALLSFAALKLCNRCTKQNAVAQQLHQIQGKQIAPKVGIASTDSNTIVAASSSKKKQKQRITKWSERNTSAKININACSAEQLRSLRGIGPVLSERAIKYRNWLGGFHEVEQLKEVYGISDSLFLTIQPQLVCSGPVQQIKINSCTDTTLWKHPYCDFKLARKIIRFRNARDRIDSLGMLMQIHGLDSATYRQLKPYLQVN